MSESAYINNSAFEAGTKRQLAWDSTSIGALKTCGRYYELTIVEGWVPKSTPVDLHFGILLHSARERYYSHRARQGDHETSLREALLWTMGQTFDTETQRPWDSGNSNKNRLTLVRTLVWYLDEWANDPLKTLEVHDHGEHIRPAVELTVSADLSNSPYTIWGHLDRLVELNERPAVSDLKTTKHTLDGGFYDRFSPDNQMTTYVWLAHHALGMPVQSIILDAAQVAVTFSRFHRGLVSRTPAHLAEWEQSLRILLAQNEAYVQANFWPMNEKACNAGRGCPFRKVCSKAPAVRQRWLEADFVRRVWNPTQERGDI